MEVHRNEVLVKNNSFSVSKPDGGAVDGRDIVSHSKNALLRLNERSLRDVVSIYELALSDLFVAWLVANPDELKGKGVTIHTLLHSHDLEQVRQRAITKAAGEHVLKLMHQAPATWFNFLNRIAAGPVVSADDVKTFIEIKATRDVLEHSGGVVNHLYIEKAGTAARFRDGEQVTVDDTYQDQAFTLIKKLLDATTQALLLNAATKS